jgi:outer membrane protein assembly factor BamB
VESSSAVIIGISGTVLALDCGTGDEVWRTSLKGSDFVNAVLHEDCVYAATKGELFCLDRTTGTIRWRNALTGLGRGLVTIASSGGGSAAMEEKRRRDQAAIAAGSAGVAASG